MWCIDAEDGTVGDRDLFSVALFCESAIEPPDMVRADGSPPQEVVVVGLKAPHDGNNYSTACYFAITSRASRLATTSRISARFRAASNAASRDP